MGEAIKAMSDSVSITGNAMAARPVLALLLVTLLAAAIVLSPGVGSPARASGGHDSLGALAPSARWYFAEGTTRSDFTTYIAVMNPDEQAASVTFTYMVGTGEPVTRVHAVAPKSRFTLDIKDDVGPDRDVSTFLSSDRAVIAERPMYFQWKHRGIVCIDPGHSGHSGSEIDPATGLNVGDNGGAPGERQAIWELALKTKARLEEAGYDVRLAKEGADAYVSIRARADIASTCDIWIRLHYDDAGFTGVMRPPMNAARCPVSDPSRITVVSRSVATGSDTLARTLAPFLGLRVRDDTGGTTQGNTTPPGHPTCLIGSVLSRVPVVCIENNMALVRGNSQGQMLVASQLVAGIDAYFAGR